MPSSSRTALLQDPQGIGQAGKVSSGIMGSDAVHRNCLYLYLYLLLLWSMEVGEAGRMLPLYIRMLQKWVGLVEYV